MNKREEKTVLRAAMSILGSRTSARKKRSSRLNGMKGKKLFKFDWPSKTGWTPESYAALPEANKKPIANALIKLALHQIKQSQKQLCPKCKRCNGAPGHDMIVAHHPDYNKPMQVELMCSTCHTKLHRSNRRAKSAIHTKINKNKPVARANG